MAFPKVLTAAAAAMVLLGTTMQTSACSCLSVYFTPCDYVVGPASTDTTHTLLVLRATALSR